ncbi:hypothetical protein GWI33_002001 [Rhynchophorus ferrugineus]|uniref:C2 domain-containing protein n=1 Tax=Rhynchophorus ferrugineus TaxID=354439 RepID=A0A834MGL3_RHYFE|nr:hypothetical protein GWI33_002001 [Rhynchophorus ferrugineus]
MNSAVIVQVGDKKKCTAVKKSNECPFYNEYFVFEFLTTYEKLMEKEITITVIRPKSFCRRRRILGCVRLDVATILNQKNSQFYHKWAVLTSPKADFASGPTGYLKLDMCVISKHQTLKLPHNIVNDDIEGNLLMPSNFVSEKQRAKFVFDVYRVDHIQTRTDQFLDFGISKVNNAAMDIKPTSYVAITFAGSRINTSPRKYTQNPTFNETLTITDSFPPLCQRVKIEICIEGFRKTVNSTHFINLKHISNDTSEGFLPTFGPTYIYMYSKHPLEGYAGTILMAMKTELMETDASTHIGQKMNINYGLAPLIEDHLFPVQETLLFGVIFEANSIAKKYHDKTISFRLTFGHITSENEKKGTYEMNCPLNITPGQKSTKTSKNFAYLKYNEKKPCLKIRSAWPDFRKRMYHSNMLEKISNELGTRLEQIEKMFLKNSPALFQKIDELLVETMDFLMVSVRKYIEIVTNNYNFDYGTKLDNERIQMCIRVMNLMLDKVREISTNKSRKFVYRKLENIHRKISSLVPDAQDCWPDVFIWMTTGNKKIAYVRVPARKIVFSNIPEEIGEHCSIITPMLYLFQDRQHVLCKVEVLLWLGLENQEDQCFSMLPKGFKYDDRFLQAEEEYLFEGRMHIFKAELQPGSDHSGLSDPFVQVALLKEVKETVIRKQEIVPVWDQTLMFYNITLYGSREHIRKYPPSILVNMLDQDKFKSEIVGRDIIRPEAKFLDDTDQTQMEYNRTYIERGKHSLRFHSLYKENEVMAKLLAAFEIVEIPQMKQIEDPKQILTIPPEIKPTLVSYKIEILFWGIRNMRKINMVRINRPRITFYCGNKSINSETIANFAKNQNFPNYISEMFVEMPNDLFHESYQIKMFDSRKFGIYVYSGVTVGDVEPFLYKPMTVQQRATIIAEEFHHNLSFLRLSDSEINFNNEDTWQLLPSSEPSVPKKRTCFTLCSKLLKKICKTKLNLPKRRDSQYSLLTDEDHQETEDDENIDWWTKFYASFDGESNTAFKHNHLKIYKSELENQPEFNRFSDMLTCFEMYKGKRTGDEALDEAHVTAVFKGSFKIYRWPPEKDDENDYITEAGTNLRNGVYSNYPENQPLQYILRVYVIRGLGLTPKDSNNKSDPYIMLQLGKQTVNDREGYIACQSNPIFGKCYELHGNFPEDHSLTIKVLDRDTVTADDLIGETKIDVENRFYTKHRASCGLSESYHSTGPYKWRDNKKPSVILSNLCKRWGLDEPVYSPTSVLIGVKEFFLNKSSDSSELDKEVLALNVLSQWNTVPLVGFQLVPEHVETRSLFAPDKPGIEQGKLQLWIDIFSRIEYPIPDRVNITPRKPISYELRVIIWNTSDVILEEDDIFTGEKKSDIYIKGWLDDPKQCQYTDIHYRSLTGEGNFSWRFIYTFDYLSTENKIVVKKMHSMFSREESEVKLPCVVHLTIWDNDTFSQDDFLGSLNLELSKLPRGARSAQKCDLSVMKPSTKRLNLFKTRRTKGWWPFRSVDKRTKKEVLGGKLEAEFEILTKEEAQKAPAGLGRQGPQALPPPKRPDTSFAWFTNPLKSCKYVVCKAWKWKLLKCGCLIFVVIFILLGIYALPTLKYWE